MKSQKDSERPSEDDLALDLPELQEEAIDEEGFDAEGEIDIDGPAAPEDGDPFEDAPAHDMALDPLIPAGADEPTVVGDDATGLDSIPTSDGVQLEDSGETALGGDDDGPPKEDDDDLLPDGDDDGGDDCDAEGMTDPTSWQLDELPPLDGDTDDL